MPSPRSSFAITFAAWKALFLREAVSRLSAGRAAWLWILLEPITHVVFLMALFGFVYHRVVNGVDGAMFIMTGLLAFFLVRNTATRSMEAISSNLALFTYRQVLPVDTVLVRATLEGFITLVSTLVLLAGASLFHLQVVPENLLEVVLCAFGLWLSGLGLGLTISVAGVLVPEISRLVRILFTPLYFISGVMFPASAIPQPQRDWLLLNPFLNGIELLRAAFFPQFRAAPEASLSYLFAFALITIFFGLALQVRYSSRVLTS